MEFTIPRPKMDQLSWNKNQTYRLNSEPQMWPSDLTLAINLDFSRSNTEFTISRPKMVRLPLKKQTYWLNSNVTITSNVTIRFHLGHDLDFELSRSNMKSAISRPKMVPLPREKSKHIDWIELYASNMTSDLSLAMTLTINFQGQIWNLLNLSQRLFDCHKMKSMHIEWTEGLND